MDHPQLNSNLGRHERVKHYVISGLFALLALSTLMTAHNYNSHRDSSPEAERADVPPMPNREAADAAAEARPDAGTRPDAAPALAEDIDAAVSRVAAELVIAGTGSPPSEAAAGAPGAVADGVAPADSAVAEVVAEVADEVVSVTLEGISQGHGSAPSAPSDRTVTVTTSSAADETAPADLSPASAAPPAAHSAAAQATGASEPVADSEAAYQHFLATRRSMEELSEGFHQRNLGNYTAAIEHLRASAASDENNFVALRELGHLYLRQLGEREKATDAYCEAAQRAIDVGSVGQAIELINRIADLDPRRAVELRKEFPPSWPGLHELHIPPAHTTQ